MSGAERSLAGLSAEEKRSLLARMLERRRKEPERFPLSFSQQRLWFLDQLEPGNAAYNVWGALVLDGRVEVAVLEASVREIVRRHDPLRTRFATAGDEPVQVVLPVVELRLPVVDLSAVEETGRRRLARALIDRGGQIPFDLGAAPLLRLRLLRLSGEEAVVLVVMHHIVADGWSLGILVRELAALYRAFAAGEPSPLPEPEVRYGDFVLWQRKWLEGEVLERQLAYWRQRLGGGEGMLELPTDRPRPAVQTFRGAAVPLVFGRDLAEALKALARGRGATLFMALVVAFQALLHRYSGQPAVSVGTAVANRDRRELEDLIGFFVNTLVLRTDFAGDPDAAGLLDRVREATLEAHEHRDVPFERVVEEVQPERDMSRPPLFQVAFVLQTAAPAGVEMPGLSLRPYQTETRSAKFDLTLDLLEGQEGLAGNLEYNRDLFDRSTVRRMAGHLGRLLSAMAADPSAPVSRQPLLTAAERAEIVREWNDTAAPCRERPMVHERFAEHARRRPEAPAVTSGDGSLTYGEVEARANALARHLRGLGVGPEALVALCTGRTPERVVGIVAVLEAGGAYVSLDPTHPPERLAFLLEDAGAPVLLTEERFAASLPAAAAEVLRLDGEEVVGLGTAGSPPPVSLTPENLAYVVYTSGSTGKPKGVAIPHAGLTNLVRWHQREYSVTADDRGTQVASPAFDASIWELWPYLAAGASVHVPDEETRLSSPGMIRWWAEQGITLAYLMTPLAEGVLEEGMPPGLEHRVRALIIGGDRLHRRPRPGVGFRLMNHYGPAEYSVTSTVVEVPPEGKGGGIPSIGRPVDNTEIYLLDRRGEPVPVGVPGELFVGGVGLARGYLRRPGLTAGKFLPHPLAPEPGARLYATGDRVRYLPDGDMDFLGRLDHQVKLRGLRIELGEIESVLGEHPGVREAVVLVREDRPGVQRLAAYLSSPRAGRPTAAELRAFAEERLPAYMVPRALVFLDAFPLTPNGKVDRSALPVPEAEGEAAHVPPGTATEARIADIWSEVLGVAEVGVEDNFFDLGGHSLRMMQIKRRLHEELGVDLPLVELFRHPTVRALAERAGAPADAGETPLPTRAARRRAARAEGGGGVAVIGMAGRFPGAEDVEELWRNLCSGVESITFFSDEELLAAGTDPALLENPRFVKAAGALDGADLFDAPFFGFNPREAQVMDPQHRLFLECAWHALEDAGYGAAEGRGTVGVFAGTSLSTYLREVLADRALLEAVGTPQALIANDKDHLPTRVSYKLDLRGPSVSVQTACSTSLVAVHLACQSLLAGECDLALAGGVSINVPTRQGHLHEEGGLLSADGHCRAFDAGATGIVDGNGAGVVVLKRLEDALADGDAPYAVVKGTAINNDGADKVGYTAPGVDGQAAVIAEAQEMAGTPPETIGYVEAHGSGTPLGDPIEIAALGRAFGSSAARGACAIGSIKTNLGHLDAAAGVAGLIKAVLAVHHGVIPPSLHFDASNPEIDFEGSPVHVASRLEDWPLRDGPRRAGVSAFGIGGTNAHAVLEEAPPPPPGGPGRSHQLLVLSARSEAALERTAARLAEHLRRRPDLDLADVAYTLQVGRQRFSHRRVLLCRDLADAVEGLDSGRGEAPAGQGASEVETALGALGSAWLAGLRVDWAGFHAGARRRRLHLPGYPFERRSYWAERTERLAAAPPPTARKPLDEWFYLAGWSRGEPASLLPELEAGEGPRLLLLDRWGLGSELARGLAEAGERVITVEAGEGFERLGPDRYRLAPGSLEGFRSLLAELAADGARPRGIAHLWTVDPPGERPSAERCRLAGFTSLLHLARAVAEELGEGPAIDLAVVSNRLHDVLGGEALDPGKAMVMGPVKVIPQELPWVRCRSVDVGEPADPAPPAPLVRDLLDEVGRRSPDNAVALRGGRRWVRSFRRVDLPAGGPTLLRRGGTYLITGGLGRIGRVLGRHLAGEYGARLVLVGRTPLPPRESWTRWLEGRAEGDPEGERIRDLLAMEEAGGEVLALAADLTDRAAAEGAVTAAVERFGPIHGVFHAAGVFGLELIQQKTAEQAARVMAPKVQGAEVLSELFRGSRDLDFLFFFSSFASVVGGVGMIDYSAANAYLDALAAANNAGGGPRTLVVDWGPWNFDFDLDAEAVGGAALEQHRVAIRPDEGVEALERILAHPLEQVLVSSRDLFDELEAVERLRREKTAKAERRSRRQPRPPLFTPYVAPRDETEEELAEIWQELLGIEKVGVHDNFYQLGGHSLLAMQVASRLRERFSVEIPLNEMLARMTVAELVVAVVERQAETLDDAVLAELLAESRGLPGEGAERR